MGATAAANQIDAWPLVDLQSFRRAFDAGSDPTDDDSVVGTATGQGGASNDGPVQVCVRSSQSTRPIQRSRLAAYQAIVRAIPSSQLTLGSQPVSRLSFS